MAAIVAFAAMLPVALLAVRHRPVWVGLVTSVPVLLLAIPTLVAMVARRVEWIVAGAPGLPPLRLAAEGTPFGSVAVPPFVLIPAWALAGLIEPPGLRRVVRTGLLAVGYSARDPLRVPFGVAGDRRRGSPSGWRPGPGGNARRLRRPRGLSARGVLIGAGVLVAGGVGLALVLPRLTAVSSLLYRGALWRDTLVAWSSDPLLGIGPGFMPFARQAAAPDFSFPVRQPHSHNLPLGVLGDAGIVGLARRAARRGDPGRPGRTVAQPHAGRPHGGGRDGRPRHRRAVRGPDLPPRIQSARDRRGGGRPARRRRGDVGAAAARAAFPASGAVRRNGRHRGGADRRDGHRRCRVRSPIGTGSATRSRGTGRTRPRGCSAPSRSTRGIRPDRRPWPWPPTPPASPRWPSTPLTGRRSSTRVTRPRGRTSRSCARRTATCPAPARRRNARSPRRATWLRSCSTPPSCWTTWARPMPRMPPTASRC